MYMYTCRSRQPNYTLCVCVSIYLQSSPQNAYMKRLSFTRITTSPKLIMLTLTQKGRTAEGPEVSLIVGSGRHAPGLQASLLRWIENSTSYALNSQIWKEQRRLGRTVGQSMECEQVHYSLMRPTSSELAQAQGQYIMRIYPRTPHVPLWMTSC